MLAYDESYLNDAMDTLGAMLDYAVADCGFDIDEFFGWFVSSGVASSFENGNPKYIAGMSGPELASEVHNRVRGEYLSAVPTQPLDKTSEYWCGWILAYYQWYCCARFEDMVAAGLLPSVVVKNYILHEADVTKFVEFADGYLARISSTNNLARLRKLRGMTQEQLAQSSGVTVRMIQLYEQGRNDLSKASVETVLNLARVIGCSVEDLLR